MRLGTSRKVGILLAGLTILLVTALWLHRRNQQATLEDSLSFPEAQRNEAGGGSEEAFRISAANGTARPDMDWARVESTNYFAYIENMRSANVPEQTIRDIIVADIHSVFAGELAAITNASSQQALYWKPRTKPTDKRYRVEEDLQMIARLNELLLRKAGALESLLGIKTDVLQELKAILASMTTTATFIPPEKQVQLFAVENELKEKAAALTGSWSAEMEWNLAKFEKEKQDALAEFLTPAELNEYLLRSSYTADMLRAKLNHFDPNEEEFRAIFKLKKEQDDELRKLRLSSDPEGYAVPSDWAERKREFEQAVRSALGEERFRDFERSQDPAFRQELAYSEKAGHPQSVANELYAVRKEIANNFFSPEAQGKLGGPEREAYLNAISYDAVNSARTIFKDELRLKEYYESPHGLWLRSISKGTAPALPNVE